MRGVAGRYTEDNLDLLKKWGGNTVRTYDAAGVETVLDMAQSRGLKVIVGLGLSAKKRGHEALDTMRDTVDRYKKHPAVLAWSLGNEIELCKDLDATFEILEEAATSVRKIDTSHPIVNVFVDFGSDPANPIISRLKHAAKYLDAFGFNTYQPACTLVERWKALEIAKPFFVGEFGWMPAFLGRRATWDPTVTFEFSSTDKTAHYKAAIASFEASSKCLGYLAYRWEGPPVGAGEYCMPSDTWHRLCSGEYMAGPGQVLVKTWKGDAPKVPIITTKTAYTHQGTTGKTYVETAWTGISGGPIDGIVRPKDILQLRCAAECTRPVKYIWTLRRQNIVNKTAWPPCVRGAAVATTYWNEWGPTKKVTETYATKNPEASLTAPREIGHYRMYVEILDDVAKTCAYASWPFCVV